MHFRTITLGTNISVALSDRLPYSELSRHTGVVGLDFESVKNAVPERKSEFIQARLLASHLIAQVTGLSNPSFPTVKHRAPVWPVGVIGSITHSKYTVGVTVQRRRFDNHGVGVDIECLENPESSHEALAMCFSERELNLLDEREYGRIIGFSAKEAVYKCFEPIIGRYIDFGEIELGAGTNTGAELLTYRSFSQNFLNGAPVSGKIFGRVLNTIPKQIITLVEFGHAAYS